LNESHVHFHGRFIKNKPTSEKNQKERKPIENFELFWNLHVHFI